LWLQLACAKPANESARVYSGPGVVSGMHANISIATFLIARGPHSYISADPALIEGQRGNRSNPLYNLFYLDVGTPRESCVISCSFFGLSSRFLSSFCWSYRCSLSAGALRARRVCSRVDGRMDGRRSGFSILSGVF